MRLTNFSLFKRTVSLLVLISFTTICQASDFSDAMADIFTDLIITAIETNTEIMEAKREEQLREEQLREEQLKEKRLAELKNKKQDNQDSEESDEQNNSTDENTENGESNSSKKNDKTKTEEIPVITKKQIRYSYFDQSKGHGLMTGIRLYLGSPTPAQAHYESDGEITYPLFYDATFCWGILPTFFTEMQFSSIPITDNLLAQMPSFVGLKWDSNEAELLGLGFGLGFNKYIMSGRYPKNLFISAGVKIIQYTQLVYQNIEHTGNFRTLDPQYSGCPYISAGFEQPLLTWFNLTIKDTLIYIHNLNGASAFQNNFYIGIGFISPELF